MPSLTEFLKINYTYNNVYSHVSMINPIGKIDVQRNHFETFWQIYCDEVMNYNQTDKYGIAEKPQKYIPIIADIDIKIKKNNLDAKLLNKLNDYDKERQIIGKSHLDNSYDELDDYIYKEEQVLTVIKIIQQVLYETIENCTDIQLTCCLLQKPIYKVDYRGETYYKNGFHLHFPYIFVKLDEYNKYILSKILKQLKVSNIFSNLGIEDSSKTLDTTIGTVPWLLYGSRKENSKAYLLTKIFDSNCKEIAIEDAFRYYQIFDSAEHIIKINKDINYFLPRILSIIPFGRYPLQLKNNLECEIVNTSKENNDKNKYHSNKKITIEENLKIAEKLLPLLNETRYQEYNEWINIGWILYNIGDGSQEALDLWLDFSAKDQSKFCYETCYNIWSKMQKGDYSIGTLKYFAKLDNPELYNQFCQEETERYIHASLDGSHYDIAKLLYSKYGHEFVCASPSAKNWFQFNGNHWEEIEEGVYLRDKISNEIVKEYENIASEIKPDILKKGDLKTEKYEQIKKKISQLKSSPFKINIMKEAADIFYNREFKNKLNTNPYLFGFKNGIYDLNKNIFRLGKPDDFISNYSHIEYIEYNENDPKVIQVYDFFEKVFPDKSVRKYFLDYTSDIFVGGNHNKKVIFWTGEGDNGKSVTQTILEKMLGPLAIKFSTKLLTGKKQDIGSAGPELARAGNGVRLAVLEEPDNDEEINNGVLKSLSGNDSYWARDLFEKGKSTKEIFPLFKLIFITNSLPKLKHSDKATWNRIRVIPFETTFVPVGQECPETYEEQLYHKKFPMDPDFSKKIPNLLSAFAWVLLEHRKKNLGKPIIEPEKVKIATSKYRNQNDVFKQYTEENIINDDNSFIKLNEIYENFKIWYKQSFPGSTIPTKNETKDKITKLWGEPTTGIKWIGKRILTIDDDMMENNQNNNKLINPLL